MTAPGGNGSFIELDPVSGWQGSTEALSPVVPAGLAVDCVSGQPTPFAQNLPPPAFSSSKRKKA